MTMLIEWVMEAIFILRHINVHEMSELRALSVNKAAVNLTIRRKHSYFGPSMSSGRTHASN
jgi:hypothetical protein